jgi:hypothetical protein
MSRYCSTVRRRASGVFLEMFRNATHHTSVARRIMVIRATFQHSLLKVDEVGESSVHERDSLGILLLQDLSLFRILDEFFGFRFLEGCAEVCGAVEDGIEEFSKRFEFVQAYMRV